MSHKKKPAMPAKRRPPPAESKKTETYQPRKNSAAIKASNVPLLEVMEDLIFDMSATLMGHQQNIERMIGMLDDLHTAVAAIAAQYGKRNG